MPIGSAVGIAFLRKVMKRHFQYEYTDPGQRIRVAGNGTATGGGGNVPDTNAALDYRPAYIKFIRRTMNAAGVTVDDCPISYDFISNPTDSLRTFGDWFADNIFNSPDFGAGDVVTTTRHLFGYQIIILDGFGSSVPHTTGGSFRVATPVIPLTDQYLSVYSTVRMHIQNVTRADGITEDDTGAVYQSTRIDANPVKGKLLRFSGPLPLIKDDRGIDMTGPADFGWRLQSDSNADGIIWPNISPVGQWLQLPGADQFRNCVGMASISLEPGAIKDYSLSFKYSGDLNKLMHGLREVIGGPDTLGVGVPTNPRAPLPNAMHQLGQSFMFALEKRMPTGNANVSVNFHYELYVGSCFGGRRKTPMTRQTLEPATTADIVAAI